MNVATSVHSNDENTIVRLFFERPKQKASEANASDAFDRESLDCVPQCFCTLNEVCDFHGFVRIVRTLLVSNEDHRSWNAEVAENNRIVTCAGRQLLNLEACLSGGLSQCSLSSL